METFSFFVAIEGKNHLPTSTMPGDFKSFSLAIAKAKRQSLFLFYFNSSLCDFFMFLSPSKSPSMESQKSFLRTTRASAKLDIIYDFESSLSLRDAFTIGLDPGKEGERNCLSSI